VSEYRASAPPAAGAVRFDQRLSVPWWYYVPTSGLGVLLGAEVHMGYPGLRSWVGYAVLVPLLLGVVTWLGRTRVTVTDTEFRVGDEVLPLRHVGRVDVVQRADKQAALGPELDPAAHLVHRPWIGPVVRVEVTDPDHPTPYWVVSVRHPERLVAALAPRT
jgi:hypothetical protein